MGFGREYPSTLLTYWEERQPVIRPLATGHLVKDCLDIIRLLQGCSHNLIVLAIPVHLGDRNRLRPHVYALQILQEGSGEMLDERIAASIGTWKAGRWLSKVLFELLG